MVIPYEIVEINKRLKKNIEDAENETDKMLYSAAREYSNLVMERAKRVTAEAMEKAMEKAEKEIRDDK